MENASKALIIAGAILISILLISVGIMIMNSAGDITDQAGAQTDSMALQSFNAQFTAYEGSGKSASQIRSLISAVNASNATSDKDVITVKVSTDTTTTFTSANIKDNTTYKVKIEGYSDGYISKLLITAE